MKTYKVLLTPYPQEFIISAENGDTAVMKAKERFSQSVWESEFEEVPSDEEVGLKGKDLR